MRSINAKRIAAVVTGAALLGAGLAFAGQVTFNSVPIISNSGQPVVQIVLGSHAQPSDGVAAANIAAAIGNLAYKSTPVTASVDAASLANLKVSVSSSTQYSLSNQQVWLNESGATSATGASYLFSALIGSVLNQGLGQSPVSTKTLSTATSYSFSTASQSTSASPLPSPYIAAGGVPFSGSVTPSYNSGGASTGFTSFRSGTSDNLLEVTSSQFSKLLNNFGSTGETEYLWITGFPVYDQASGVNNFALLNAGGAYEVIFNKPIANTVSSGSPQINVPITLLGMNYTIINATSSGLNNGGSSNAYKAGGMMYLASSIASLSTVYVGHNITSGPWTVQLEDLGQPNSNGISAASVGVWYNGLLTNTSSIPQASTAKFNVSGHLLYVNVNTTFAGLYSYQKWAKMQMYSNVFKVQNAHVYNQSTNPGWYANLLWTNTTGGTGTGSDNQLYGLILYNFTTTNLAPGQSFSFIQNPSQYKLTFLGDTLGSGAYDALSVTSTQTNVQYQNSGTNSGTGLTGSIKNVTEPAQELVVSSQIPNAFSYAGQTGSSVTYIMTPFKLTEVNANVIQTSPSSKSFAVMTYNNPAQYSASTSPWWSSSTPLTITIQGYASGSSNTPITNVVQYTYNTLSGGQVTNTLALNNAMLNVTSITVQNNQALPIGSAGAFNVVVQNADAGNYLANTVILASLAETAPAIIYPASSSTVGYQNSFILASGTTVYYNQQNGQPTTTVSLTTANPSTGGGAQKYGVFKVFENPVGPTNASTDALSIGVFNSTQGVVAAPLFYLNYSGSGGTHNNVTYTSYGTSVIDVKQGFRTEKGSKVSSISPTQVTFDMATGVDQLQFVVGGNTGNNTVSRAYSLHGPYSVGQATNIPNVSIGRVNASVTLSGGAGSPVITGEGNLTATPSVTQATVPVWLRNLSSTAPLVVLDTATTNPGSSLILIGSGYVNALSAQLQGVNITTSNPGPFTEAVGTSKILVAGYTADQTTTAANNFIDALYNAAATS